MHTSPTPTNIPTSFSPEQAAPIDTANPRPTDSPSKPREGRGAKNPKWGKGPSLQEQALFLQGMYRDEYNRQYVNH